MNIKSPDSDFETGASIGDATGNLDNVGKQNTIPTRPDGVEYRGVNLRGADKVFYNTADGAVPTLPRNERPQDIAR